MKLKLPIIMSLLLLGFTAFSQQQLSGSVFDTDGNETLIGASVFVKELKSGTITDLDGNYLIKLPKGKYTLKISYIGYSTLEKQITITSKDVTQDFFLDVSSEDIEEVVVSAKSKARKLREQAMPVSIITMESIQGTVSNVNDILAKTAGIKIRNSGGVGSASRISVRGLEGKRIGFFIDGTPMNDNADVISLNDIPIDMIERIEVYKGIVPAKFGGSAIGGAVNLVLKEYPAKYVDLSYSLQSYNTHNAGLIFKNNNPGSGYEFGFGGFYTHSDNNYTMESPYVSGLKIKRDHDVFEKKVIGLGFTSEKWWFDEVVFEPAYTYTKQEIQGIKQNIQHATTSSEAFIITNHMEKIDFLATGLDFEFNIAYAYTLYDYIDTAMQRYNFDGTTYAPVTALGGEIGTNPNDAHNKKHVVIQKINLNYLINENSSLNLNTVYNYAHGIPKDDLKDKVIGFKTNYESTMNSLVVGLNYEQHLLNKKLTNSLSAKYYNYSIETTLINLYGDGVPTPVNFSKHDYGISNAIRYRFTKDFLIKASFSYDVRLPSETELLGDGFMIVASGNLEPEKNSSINVGLMYNHENSKNNDFQIELNVFYMQLENMIRFTGGPLQSQYLNFGEMRTLGADLDIKYDLTRFIYLYGNVTWQDLRDTRKTEPGATTANPTKGDRIPNIPYLYANAGFELHKANLFGGKKQNSKFYFESAFVEEYFYDFEQSIYQKRRIPQALSHNIGIEHSFRNNNISIGIQVNNITDETLLSEFNRPLPGRTAGLKMRYTIR